MLCANEIYVSGKYFAIESFLNTTMPSFIILSLLSLGKLIFFIHTHPTNIHNYSGTYTESWTSATTEADKVNSPQPVIMLDKESTSEESLNLPGVSNMPAEHSLPKPIPVIATRVPLLGQPQGFFIVLNLQLGL